MITFPVSLFYLLLLLLFSFLFSLFPLLYVINRGIGKSNHSANLSRLSLLSPHPFPGIPPRRPTSPDVAFRVPSPSETPRFSTGPLRTDVGRARNRPPVRVAYCVSSRSEPARYPLPGARVRLRPHCLPRPIVDPARFGLPLPVHCPGSPLDYPRPYSSLGNVGKSAKTPPPSRQTRNTTGMVCWLSVIANRPIGSRYPAPTRRDCGANPALWRRAGLAPVVVPASVFPG